MRQEPRCDTVFTSLGTGISRNEVNKQTLGYY